MARWLRRIFRDGVKTHVYPVTLEPRLLNNWRHRGFRLHPGIEGAPANWPYHETKEASISAGHSGFTDETWEGFELTGLKLSIRAREVEHYLEQLEGAPVRLEIKRPYYKIHGFSECLCLLPVQRKILIGMLKERLPRAKATAAAEAVELNQRLDEMADHPHLDIKHRLPEGRLEEA